MRSFKEESKDHGHLHEGNRPGKAVEGGIYWYAESLYHVPPNVHTKSVLYSECDRLAYGYLTDGAEDDRCSLMTYQGQKIW